MASDQQRAEMRAEGQAIIRERYTWDDVCRRYTDLLLSLADRKAGIAAT